MRWVGDSLLISSCCCAVNITRLRPHFVCMAATRAAARALRRALNVSACSVEELAGDET